MCLSHRVSMWSLYGTCSGSRRSNRGLPVCESRIPPPSNCWRTTSPTVIAVYSAIRSVLLWLTKDNLVGIRDHLGYLLRVVILCLIPIRRLHYSLSPY